MRRVILSPVEIDGEVYVPAMQVERELGVVRQTLWRWRSDAKVPFGRRHRNGQIIFTLPEVEKIRQFANSFAPSERPDPNQLALFRGRSGG